MDFDFIMKPCLGRSSPIDFVMEGHPPGGQAPELYLQNQGCDLLTEYIYIYMVYVYIYVYVYVYVNVNVNVNVYVYGYVYVYVCYEMK